MVNFYANPDDQNEIWIEKAAFEGTRFRIWHYIFFCLSAFTILGKPFKTIILSTMYSYKVLKRYNRYLKILAVFCESAKGYFCQLVGKVGNNFGLVHFQFVKTFTVFRRKSSIYSGRRWGIRRSPFDNPRNFMVFLYFLARRVNF